MAITRRYTSPDLALLPDVEGIRYEIIDGNLHVSKQPHWHHQYVCNRVSSALDAWNDQTGMGFVLFAPGVIFSPENDVVPDLVWISRDRVELLTDQAGHLRGAPELVLEVLSFGAANEKRDRDTKLQLYSRQGVQEYWLANWRSETLDVFRRSAAGLQLTTTLRNDDVLVTPLLPGFSLVVSRLWPPAFRTGAAANERAGD